MSKINKRVELMLTNHNNHYYFFKNMVPDANNQTKNESSFFFLFSSKSPKEFQEKQENESDHKIHLRDRQALNCLCNVYFPHIEKEKN